MDNLTHSLIGAGIAGALLTRRVGARGMLVGVVAANLPDVDVFIPHANLIDTMTYHRGFTHSLLFETAVAPLVAGGIALVWPKVRPHWWPLLLTVWLCFITHALLDALTTYGTQLFWPFAVPPAAFSSIFIIDPLFTLMLLVGIIITVVRRKRPGQGRTANLVTLGLACLYLGAGMAGHMVVKARASADPVFAGEKLFVQPGPINILFWNVMAVTDNQIIRGNSLFFPGCPITGVEFEPRYANPPEGFALPPSAKRLEWFTNGFYMFNQGPEGLSISDLRIGFERALPFTFLIAKPSVDGYEAVMPRQVGGTINPDNTLTNLFQGVEDNWRKCWG